MLIIFLVLLVVSGVFCGSAAAVVRGIDTAQNLSNALNLTTDSGVGAAYVNGEGKVVLLQDVWLNHTITITARDSITLTANESNDFTIYRHFDDGFLFMVSSGTFILEGSNGHNLTIDGNRTTYSSNGSSLVYVDGGEFTMNAGSVLQNSNTPYYGGVVSVKNDGMFTMNGGTISDNNAFTYGGGVYVMDGGTFTMNGGTISNNTANSFGGGVYVDDGTFTMNDGTISNNNATTYYGGGVYVTNSGTFTMNGGTIDNNNAAVNGGGVGVVSGGTFNMTGGSIDTNTANNDGGGVYVDGGTFTMNDGTISYNNAGYGGGVYVVYDGMFNMIGGTIDNNNAAGHGGGVGVSSGMFNMTGGTIDNNNAMDSGSGVYVSGGTFNMTRGTISNNTANSVGGGVYVFSGTFTMDGGSISNNSAEFGGGVYVNWGTFTMNNGTISGNNATCYGGGVYVFSDTFTMEGGTISSNTAINGGGVYVFVGGPFNMNGSAVVNVDNDVYMMTDTFINVTGILATDTGAKNITPGFTDIGYRVVEYGSVDRNNWASNFALNTTWSLVNSRALTNTGSNLSLIENITVNFYLDEVSNVEYSTITNLSLNDTISEPSAPAKPGYTFNGWNITNASGTSWNFSTDNVLGYTQLYANWTVNPTPTPTSSENGGNGDNNADFGPVSANGTFTTNDGGLTLRYPAGSSIIVTVFRDYFNGAAAPSGVSYLNVYDVHSTADSGTSVTLVFRVNASVLENKGLTPEDISILRHNNNEWERMTITSIERVDGEYLFTVTSYRTSVFMIACNVDGSWFPLEEAEETSTPTTGPTLVEPTVLGSTINPTKAASSPVPVLGIIAGLVGMALLTRRE